MALLCLAPGLLAAASTAARSADIAVRVENRSEATLCAEKDNVTLAFTAAGVTGFRVIARHPAYIGTLQVDRFAADWDNCDDIPRLPEHRFAPSRRTLYEDIEWQLVGLTFAAFWRPNLVPVRIDDRVQEGVHLLQLWVRRNERAEEVLVLYPSDGYWRARPLPPPHLRWSAYGTSFLVGPVEEAGGRPIVDIAEVAFEPATRRFTLALARGGALTLSLARLDEDAIVLDVAADRPFSAERPFAALRSMFVTEINADVAHLLWRPPGGLAWESRPLPQFRSAEAVEVWAGRLVPSRHNTSAPDMILGPFRSDR